MTTRRVLICNPRQIDTPTLEAFVEEVRRAFAGRTLNDGTPCTFEFTTARDAAVARQEARPGLPFNWQDWVIWASGTEGPFTQEPRFHYYIVGPSRTIGRATAELVVRAHNSGRKVLALHDGALVAVTGVEVVDEESWATGFRVQV